MIFGMCLFSCQFNEPSTLLRHVDFLICFSCCTSSKSVGDRCDGGENATETDAIDSTTTVTISISTIWTVAVVQVALRVLAIGGRMRPTLVLYLNRGDRGVDGSKPVR